MGKIVAAPVPYKISHLIARLSFRGIYSPQRGSLAWFKVMIENRSVILRITLDSFTIGEGRRRPRCFWTLMPAPESSQ